MKRARQGRWAVAMVVVGVPLLAGCGQLKTDELARAVETLQSIAAEGNLVADGVVHDRTKATFVRVHGAELSDAAAHEAEKLSDSDRNRALEAYVRRAVDIAQAESDALDQLRVAPNDSGQALRVRADLKKYADEAEKLAGQVHSR